MTSPHETTASPLLVTAALIRQGDKILLTQRPLDKPHGGYWEFPGGKIEPGESPAQALTRELSEELALDVQVGAIADALYHRYEWGPVLILVYHCIIFSGTPRNIEVEDHRWVPLEDLTLYKVLPADRPLLERLQAETAKPG